MPGLAGAMRAAVDHRARLHAMTADPDPAVVADGSKGVRGALEAVKGVRISPDDAGIVCAALIAGSCKTGEGLPRSASALKQQVPWMPPVNYPEGHFLALIIASNALDNLCFLNRFVAPRGRVSNLHFCSPPFPTGGYMILLLQASR